MQEVMINPPRTIMEVFKMLPEGTLAEVIDNTLYMSPAPVSNHQRIIGKLFTQLTLHVNARDLGEVFISPFDVYLDEEANAVQPDIFFIPKGKLSIVEEQGYVHGVPDLVIEVLSPGNKMHDTVIKKNLYEKFGVKEYWIIDPETKQATGYSLNRKQYQRLPEEISKITSPLLNGTFYFE